MSLLLVAVVLICLSSSTGVYGQKNTTTTTQKIPSTNQPTTVFLPSNSSKTLTDKILPKLATPRTIFDKDVSVSVIKSL